MPRGVCATSGVELQSVEFPGRIFHRGEGRTGRPGSDPETFGQTGHFVAMAVPDIEVRAQTFEEGGSIRDLEHAGAILPASAELNASAEMMRHQH